MPYANTNDLLRQFYVKSKVLCAVKTDMHRFLKCYSNEICHLDRKALKNSLRFRHVNSVYLFMTKFLIQ